MHLSPAEVIFWQHGFCIPQNGGVLPRLCEVAPGAEVFERKLRKMFGIEITGLHTPDRLYLTDEWPESVYPMRKDLNPKALSANL